MKHGRQAQRNIPYAESSHETESRRDHRQRGRLPERHQSLPGNEVLYVIRHGNKKGGIIITMIEADDIMEPPAYLDSFKYDNLEDMEKLSVNALLSPSLSL